MVYCGRPSRGCQMCRARRIKCDETKPTCNQCAKSRRECPGYKDDFDLVFRNETKATERRALKANKKAAAQRLQAQNDPSSSSSSEMAAVVLAGSSTSRNRKGNSSSVKTSLGLSLEDRASCHFVSNFVLMARDGRSVGHLEFVMPLLQQAGPDSHFRHAFDACAMAFMHNVVRRGDDHYYDRAMAQYTAALHKTNAALRNKDDQLSDATLAAVLMLGMFENISARQINSFNWGSHISGAVQLVKFRGKQALASKIGMQLFVAVRTLMSVYCLSASQAPTMGAEWWLDMTAHNTTAVTVQRLMIKTSEIRARSAQLVETLLKSPPGSTSAVNGKEAMLEMIRHAQAVDREVVAWQQAIPGWWQYRTIAWEDSVPGDDYGSAEVFPGRVDVYPDLGIGSVTNSARTMRVILHAVIVRCAGWVCSPVDYRTTPEYATAVSVCRDSITDIIASIPYHMGWHVKARKTSSQQGQQSKANFGSFACGEEATAKGLAGYFVTWPLTCILSQDYMTDAQRAYVLGRLRTIGGDLGVKYALAMSQIQYRVPSMLIRRDAFMKMSPAAVASMGGLEGMQKMMATAAAQSGSSVPSSSKDFSAAAMPINSQQQWETMQRMRSEQGKANLVKHLLSGAAGFGDIHSKHTGADARGRDNNEDAYEEQEVELD